MSDLNWIQIAGIVGTIAPLVTIAIALYAVGSWKRTLEQQRADECVSAARYLEGAVGRLVSLRLNRKMPPLEDSSREMWDGWRKFIQAYTVAQRYHKALSEEMLADIYSALVELGETPRVANEDANEAKQRLDRLIGMVVSRLNPSSVKRAQI